MLNIYSENITKVVQIMKFKFMNSQVPTENC